MVVHELPNSSMYKSVQGNDSLVIYHYSSDKDSFREKAILKQNAFSLVINGHKTMHFAEKTVRIKSNEIHLLSAGNCIASVTIHEKRPFESILFFFDSKQLLDFYTARQKQTTGVGVNASAINLKAQSYVEFEKDKFILNFIQSLLLLLKGKQSLSESMKQAKLQELFAYLADVYPEKLMAFRQAQSVTNLELKIRGVVEANTDNHLSLEELAFLCNVSVSTFKRHFKKLYNSSPAEWNNKQRMQLALRLLANEKPGEIWHKLGFETHTGFTKSFKKQYGLSPKEYVGKLTNPD